MTQPASTIRADPWVPGRRLHPDALAPRVGAGSDPSDGDPQPTDSSDWFEDVAVDRLTDAALDAAGGPALDHAAVRLVNTRTAYSTARDGRPTGSIDDVETGLSVRVVVDGCWGFAASGRRTVEAAADTARRAVAMADLARHITSARVELAPEPRHRGIWSSPFAVDPFEVPDDQRQALLADRSGSLARGTGVDHGEGRSFLVRERTHYADSHGTSVQQQRLRVEAQYEAVALGEQGAETMRTLAPPVARGWEYVQGPSGPVGPSPGWDWDEELAAIPELLQQKVRAPSITAGEYDLVIDPTNLWLTIHESVGHATEWDRVLGYEANYAGGTFVGPQDPGILRYGSPLMRVTGDRSIAGGLASVAWDDEGVAAQDWDIISEGILATPQLDRAMAAAYGHPRSNGCAYADSAFHPPLQRMPNVSLQPGSQGLSTEELAAGVGEGLLVLGDDSWSIDMQRRNFQFTGQRFYRIRDGRIGGQVKDVAYQSSTPRFWSSLAGLGGPGTFMLGGALNCGKGQPGQTAPVSHGCPVALFTGINVLNTRTEAHQ